MNDGIIVAQLHGTVRRYARWEPPDDATSQAAVTELREIAGGRADLLAHVAGIILGSYEGTPDEPRGQHGAEFCRLAGADESQVPGWVAVGRERAARTRGMPYGRPREQRSPARTEPRGASDAE